MNDQPLRTKKPMVLVLSVFCAILAAYPALQWFTSWADRKADQAEKDRQGSTAPASDSAEAKPKRNLPPELLARIKAAELSKDKQNFIWDAEHITFELETRFGKPFVEAIKNNDQKQVASYLRTDFQGNLPQADDETRLSQGPIAERKRTSTSQKTGAGEFASQIFDWLSEFESVAKGRLRVLHLDTDENDSTLWNTELLLTVEGETAAQQKIVSESHHHAVFVLPDDSVIGKEPIIKSWVADDESRRVSKTQLFREITAEVGLDEAPLMDNWAHEKKLPVQYWKQVAVEDFNRDGYLDIAAASNLGRPVLLQSVRGERYQDVAQLAALKSWPVAVQNLCSLAAWIDYDNDGFSDLMLGPFLYHNEEGKAFRDVTPLSGLVIKRDPMGAIVADYDCDGLLDIYILYQHDHKTSAFQPWVGDVDSGAENQLWKNMGGGRFKDVTEISGASGGRKHSFAATWHFLDDDKYPDLYIANDFGNNVHLRNKGDGTFEDASQTTGMADFATSMGVVSGDINNDGRTDFYVANMYSKMGRRIIDHVGPEDYPEGVYKQIQGSCAGNRLYVQGQQGSYRDFSDDFGVNAVGWAYAPNMVDLDGDSFLDLYAATGFMSFERGKPDG